MNPAIWSPVHLHDHSALRVDVVGNKFARIAAARHVAVIPDAYCLPTDWFTRALGEDRLARIRELFAELAATLGNDVAGLQPKVATILDQLALTEQMRTELAATLATLANGDNHDTSFASGRHPPARTAPTSVMPGSTSPSSTSQPSTRSSAPS